MGEPFRAPGHWTGWNDPRLLLEETSAAITATPAERLFNDPACKVLREAWIAARFARRVAAGRPDRVRLVDGTFPDFEMRRADVIHPFEIVEADTEGRRRGDEYRRFAASIARGEPPPVEIIDPDEESARAIPVIEERVRRKAAKAYAARVNLLVYVNFWAPSDIRRTVQALAERIEPWRESFTATWLLWGDEVFRC